MALPNKDQMRGFGTETFALKPRFALSLLVFLAAGIYIGNAAYPSLLDDADASHANVSRSMLERGDWVILYMNGIRYLVKAPLHYWAVALCYRLFGANTFSTRLPVALGMVGLVALIYCFARRYFGERAGLYSGLIACTSAGFFLFTRIMIPEAIYALEFTAIFYLFLRGWTGTLEPRLAYWSAAALTALAMLTRGLVGVIFPVAIVGLFIVATRGWTRWRDLRLFSSSLIFLAISAPWHILAALRARTFFWSYFINEHFKRAVGTRYPPDYEAVPLWIWLGIHLVWFFPWSVFLAGVWKLVPHQRTWKSLSVEGQARLLLVFWMGFILFFFSLTFGSRMEYYSFGAWPAMALLLGVGLGRAEQQGKRWLRVMQAALAVLGVLIAGVLGTMLWISAKVQVPGDISSLLEERDIDSYRVSMAHLLDLTPRAFAALRLPSALAGFAFLFGFAAAWWLRRKNRPLAATILTAVAMVARIGRQQTRDDRLEKEDEDAVQRDEPAVGRGSLPVRPHVDGEGHERLVEEQSDEGDQAAERQERPIGQRRPQRLPLLVHQMARPGLGDFQIDHCRVREGGQGISDEEPRPAVSRHRSAQGTADGETEVHRPVEHSVGARPFLGGDQVGDRRGDHGPVQLAEQAEKEGGGRDVKRSAGDAWARK